MLQWELSVEINRYFEMKCPQTFKKIFSSLETVNWKPAKALLEKR